MPINLFTTDSKAEQDTNMSTEQEDQGEERLELLNFIAAMHVWALRGIKRDIFLYAVLCIFFSVVLGVFIFSKGDFELFGKFSLASTVVAGVVCAARLDARYRRAKQTRTELRQTTDEMRSLGARVPDAEDMTILR
ncbi:MAG: hypothetical protein ACNI3A_06230 [Desulfovibrio sp.]|uniref:hypothetical protein n=1 Tax=Desulfovibrio sp. 7SRBS1 TaxID=3378064 RepID=UPI003B3CD3D2